MSSAIQPKETKQERKLRYRNNQKAAFAGYSEFQLQTEIRRYLDEKGNYKPRLEGPDGMNIFFMVVPLAIVAVIALLAFIVELFFTPLIVWVVAAILAVGPICLFALMAYGNVYQVIEERIAKRRSFELLSEEIKRRHSAT